MTLTRVPPLGLAVLAFGIQLAAGRKVEYDNLDGPGVATLLARIG